MNFKTITAFALLALFITACKKDKEPYEGRLLKKITYLNAVAPERSLVDTFIYTAQKRLVGIKHFQATSQFDKAIEYDGQGRLTRAVYSYEGATYYAYQFIYNNAGQVVKKVATPFSGYAYAYDHSFTYDNSGRIIADTTYFQQTNQVLYYSTYHYDSKGNITETTNTDPANTANSSKQVTSYDTNPNPYHELGAHYYVVTGITGHLCQNNPIAGYSPWYTHQVTHAEYQQNGLPKKMIADVSTTPFAYQSIAVYEYQ